MRRAGRVVAQGDRTKVPQKRRAGVPYFLTKLLRVDRGDVQMFGCQQVRQPTRLGGIASMNQRTKLLEALDRNITATQLRHLPL